jgi:hypothetical protein
MRVVHPENFGRAIIHASQTMHKSQAGSAVVTAGAGHVLAYHGESPNQDFFTSRKPMGYVPMQKAQVTGYTRADGTRVEGYERNTTPTAPSKPAAKPRGHSPNIVGTPVRLFPAGDAKKATAVHFAGKQYSATGERGTVKDYGHQVRKFKNADGQHLWMDEHGRIHGGSEGHAQKLRERHQAHATGATDSAIKPAVPAQATQAPAQPLAKGMPVIFRKVKAAARRVDVSGLLGEMKRAQSAPGMFAKSHGAEIWAHGAGAFA